MQPRSPNSTAFPMLTEPGQVSASCDRTREIGHRRVHASIFEVSAIALLLSWLAAVVVILFGYRILSEHRRAVVRFSPRCEKTRARAMRKPRTRRLPSITMCTTLHLTAPARLIAGASTAADGCRCDAGAVRGIGVHAGPAAIFPFGPPALIVLRLPEGASLAATLPRRSASSPLESARNRSLHRLRRRGAPRFLPALGSTIAAPNFAQFVVRQRASRREKLARFSRVLRTDYSSVRTRISRSRTPPIGFPVQSASPAEIARYGSSPKKLRGHPPIRHRQCAVRLG